MAINLHDYEKLARASLSDAHWAYLNGAAADGLTLTENLAAWSRLKLHPRVLRPLAGGHTRVSVLGHACAHPILLAPVAYQKLAHADGELATAYAAAAQQAGLVLSMQASVLLEEVAEAFLPQPERGLLWMQLYIHHDRGLMRSLLRRIEEAGYEAIVVTVDAPASGARDEERRASFQLPSGIGPVNMAEAAPLPAPALQAGQSALFDHLLHQAPTWDDITWLQGETRLPIVLKGILHEDDAAQATRLGVQGLIVSNHGGRTLDTAVSTAWALPRIVDAVGDGLPVLVDGGIRRGTDVLKALALGAKAVLIGRPYVHALAASGAMGVAHVIRLLRDEFEIAMALSGCRTTQDIHRALIAADTRSV
jgi:4-hydroxymandelate oxidase